MNLLANTKIDFMKYRKVFVWVSVALLLVAVGELFVIGKLNLGIDFAGGTQLTVKFQEEPDPDQLRSIMTAAGIEDTSIQRFGDAGDNEVIIKTATVSGSEQGSQALIVEALDAALGTPGTASSFDLNRNGREALTDLLIRLDPQGLLNQESGADVETLRPQYRLVADAVIDVREEDGMFAGVGDLDSVSGVDATTLQAIRDNVSFGNYAVLGAENVGPQIGGELRKKGIAAIVLSLLGMLIYIWVRFELRFGVGALVALTHDVLITLGLFALMNFEFNLTTVAAFLTVVGYSVNDSVVVFDRVRENLRRTRSQPLVEVMNLSLNQTLSRTVLTSGTTLIVVGSLLFAGGDVLRGFAFIIAVGVIIGTYSSIYVASPFALLWEEYFGRDAKIKRSEARAA